MKRGTAEGAWLHFWFQTRMSAQLLRRFRIAPSEFGQRVIKQGKLQYPLKVINPSKIAENPIEITLPPRRLHSFFWQRNGDRPSVGWKETELSQNFYLTATVRGCLDQRSTFKGRATFRPLNLHKKWNFNPA